MIVLDDGLVTVLVACGFNVVFTLVSCYLAVGWVETRLRSVEAKVRNGRSQDSKLDKQQQKNLAILRAKELHEGGASTWEIAKTVAIEYPSVALEALAEAKKLAEQLGGGQLGLEEFVGD